MEHLSGNVTSIRKPPDSVKSTSCFYFEDGKRFFDFSNAETELAWLRAYVFPLTLLGFCMQV